MDLPMEMEKVGSNLAPSIIESEDEVEMDPEMMPEQPDTATINKEKQYEEEMTEKGRVSNFSFM